MGLPVVVESLGRIGAAAFVTDVCLGITDWAGISRLRIARIVWAFAR